MSLKNLQDDASHLGLTPEEFSRVFTPMPGYGKFNVGRYAKHAEDAMAIHNSLGTCIIYTIFGTDVIHVEKLADLYSAGTGIHITPQELKCCGERVFTLYKLLNVREGWTFRDKISQIWLTPRVTPDGPKPLKDYYQEHELTASAVEQLLDEYYAERGWDSNGIPTRERLKDLDLSEFSI